MNAMQQDLAFQRDLFSLNNKNNLIEYRNVLIRATTEAERELGEKIFDRAVIRFFIRNIYNRELKINTFLIKEIQMSLERILINPSTRKIQWYYNRTSSYSEIQGAVEVVFVKKLYCLSLLFLFVYYFKNRNTDLIKNEIIKLIRIKLKNRTIINKFIISLLPRNSAIHKEPKVT